MFLVGEKTRFYGHEDVIVSATGNIHYVTVYDAREFSKFPYVYKKYVRKVAGSPPRRNLCGKFARVAAADLEQKKR